MNIVICPFCAAETEGAWTEKGVYLPVCGRCSRSELSREERAIAERLKEPRVGEKKVG